MDDRGELIVRMARQMLDADPELGRPARRPARAIPAVVLIAVLAAASGGGTAWWLDQVARPMNGAERFEMNAMIAYAARARNADEAGLRRALAARFEIAGLDALPAHDLPAARDWLIRQTE